MAALVWLQDEIDHLCLKHWSGDISSLLASCSAFVGDFSALYLPLQQLKLIETIF